MDKDKDFDKVVAELNIPSDVMFDETDVRRIVNNTIKAVKKVMEAERNANIQAELDKMVQVGTFDAKNELGTIEI